MTNEREIFLAAQEEERLKRMADLRAEFELQVGAIDDVTKAMLSLDKAADGIEKTTAINNFRKKITSLNEEMEIPPLLFGEIQRALDSTDPTQIEAVTRKLIEWLGINEELVDAIPGLGEALEDVKNTSISAIDNLAYSIDVLGGKYTLNARQMMDWNDWLGQSLWNLAGDAINGITLVGDHGEQVTIRSMADIHMVIKNNIISQENFAAQALGIITKLSADAASIIAQNLGNLLSGLPLLPPIGGGGVGGGGGGGRSGSSRSRHDSRRR